MADQETETEVEVTAAPKKGKGKLVWILVTVLLVAGGAGAGLYFGGLLGSDTSAADAAAAADSGAGSADGKAAEKPVGKPIFHAMEPAFVVNLDGDGTRYLQASVQVMARSQATIDAVEEYQPVIRNNLLLLYSSQTLEKISSREGKEALRQATLDEINKILEAQGDAAPVEAVYFTSFVMQ